MECTHEDTSDGVRIIRLVGRMDVEGNEKIALKFNVLTVVGGPVVVDLTRVEFLSSLGIGTLLSGAKNVKLRGGVLAVYGANPNVLSTFERTNLPALIPTCATLVEAHQRVTASAES